MAAASAAGVIDPTKTGKYPVILSDALLGKSAKEIYTGVRYNHKPALSSDTAPAAARLKPSPGNNGGGAASYDLSFTDDGGRYAYSGSRSSTPDSSNGSSPFVLIFDPSRQAFVLHRVDSVFNMNLTRTATNSDPEALREEFPHLNSTIKVQVGSTAAATGSSSSGAGAGAVSKSKPAGGEKSGMKALAKLKEHQSRAKKAAEKERREAPAPISVPEPLAKAEKVTKRRDRSPAESEEDDDDDDDDDGGLLIEYPEGEAPASRFNQTTDFSPAFPVRRFSEFVRDGDDDQDDDADGEEEFDIPDMPEDEEEEEEEDEPMEKFKLPSPVGQQNQQETEAADDDDMEDLEAALEKEFAMDSESSVSEED